MGCCFCCLSEADKVARVLHKFPVTRIGNIIPGIAFPQMLIGRVTAYQGLYQSPVNNKSCVYYEVIAEEEVERLL